MSNNKPADSMIASTKGISIEHGKELFVILYHGIESLARSGTKVTVRTVTGIEFFHRFHNDEKAIDFENKTLSHIPVYTTGL